MAWLGRLLLWTLLVAYSAPNEGAILLARDHLRKVAGSTGRRHSNESAPRANGTDAVGSHSELPSDKTNSASVASIMFSPRNNPDHPPDHDATDVAGVLFSAALGSSDDVPTNNASKSSDSGQARFAELRAGVGATSQAAVAAAQKFMQSPWNPLWTKKWQPPTTGYSMNPPTTSSGVPPTGSGTHDPSHSRQILSQFLKFSPPASGAPAGAGGLTDFAHAAAASGASDFPLPVQGMLSTALDNVTGIEFLGAPVRTIPSGHASAGSTRSPLSKPTNSLMASSFAPPRSGFPVSLVSHQLLLPQGAKVGSFVLPGGSSMTTQNTFNSPQFRFAAVGTSTATGTQGHSAVAAASDPTVFEKYARAVMPPPMPPRPSQAPHPPPESEVISTPHRFLPPPSLSRLSDSTPYPTQYDTIVPTMHLHNSRSVRTVEWLVYCTCRVLIRLELLFLWKPGPCAHGRRSTTDGGCGPT